MDPTGPQAVLPLPWPQFLQDKDGNPAQDHCGQIKICHKTFKHSSNYSILGLTLHLQLG